MKRWGCMELATRAKHWWRRRAAHSIEYRLTPAKLSNAEFTIAIIVGALEPTHRRHAAPPSSCFHPIYTPQHKPLPLRAHSAVAADGSECETGETACILSNTSKSAERRAALAATFTPLLLNLPCWHSLRQASWGTPTARDWSHPFTAASVRGFPHQPV